MQTAGTGATRAERQRISILGATGSIGTSTLDLVGRDPQRWSVVALTAQSNAAALAAAARTVGAEIAVVADPAAYAALKDHLAGTGIEAAAGPQAVVEAAGRTADLVMSAIVGAAGLAPSLAALGAARTVALANKETLVCAGDFFMAEAARAGVRILPVDSEHNAVFQVLEMENMGEVAEIILTASGGPFRTATREHMTRVRPAEALKHPNWSMGRKISIDSATLMNKGLELIEASHLFPVRPEQLKVVVHPQSVVHGIVRYTDGALLAELGSADMRTPIAHCLAWPDRRPTPVKPLDLIALGSLTFEAPDRERFPCLAIAEAALASGHGAPCVLNAANEVAVEAFLNERIGFLDIAAIAAETLSRASSAGMMRTPASLADAIGLDEAARALAAEEIGRRAA